MTSALNQTPHPLNLIGRLRARSEKTALREEQARAAWIQDRAQEHWSAQINGQWLARKAAADQAACSGILLAAQARGNKTPEALLSLVTTALRASNSLTFKNEYASVPEFSCEGHSLASPSDDIEIRNCVSTLRMTERIHRSIRVGALAFPLSLSQLESISVARSLGIEADKLRKSAFVSAAPSPALWAPVLERAASEWLSLPKREQAKLLASGPRRSSPSP